MKITLAASTLLFALWTGCPDQTTTPPAGPAVAVRDQTKGAPRKGMLGGNDSPIIISDGSAHIVHQMFKLLVDSGDSVTRLVVDDPSFQPTALSCDLNIQATGDEACPIQLAQDKWDLTLQNYGVEFAHLAFDPRNSTSKIKVKLDNNAIDPETDGGGGVNVGFGTVSLSKAILTHGAKKTTLTCTKPHNCTMEIHYCPNGVCS